MLQPPQPQQLPQLPLSPQPPLAVSRKPHRILVQSEAPDHPKAVEGWTEVTRKKRKSTQKGEKVTASPVKNPEPASETI